MLHRFCEIDPLFPGLTQIPSRCWADSCLGIHTVNKEWRWGGTRCREQTNRQTVQCRDTNRRGSHIPMSPQLTKEINTHTTIKCPESCCRCEFFKIKLRILGWFIIDITILSTPFRDIDDFTLSELQGPLIAGSHHINGQLV